MKMRTSDHPGKNLSRRAPEYALRVKLRLQEEIVVWNLQDLFYSVYKTTALIRTKLILEFNIRETSCRASAQQG